MNSPPEGKVDVGIDFDGRSWILALRHAPAFGLSLLKG
jgi:hypothetical protein